MREFIIDLWHVPHADATVITTNGFVKKNGRAVMGRGCALEAARRYPRLPRLLGRMIQADGNHVYDLWKPRGQPVIVSFPVKRAWWERADPALIARSADELVEKADRLGWQIVAMPRPGCGNGQLSWDAISHLLTALLDDRFVVCHMEGK